MEDKKHELRQIAEKSLPEVIVALGFTEHQIDLMGRLILDIVEGLDPASLSPETVERVEMLKQLIYYSSVDFEDLSNPLQAYKIPKAIEVKEKTRDIQGRYLNAQLRAGVFGK
jgi:hypothetical protein